MRRIDQSVVRTKNVAVNISFLLRWTAKGVTEWFGNYGVFRKACFLPLEYTQVYTTNRNSIASAPKENKLFFSN